MRKRFENNKETELSITQKELVNNPQKIPIVDNDLLLNLAKDIRKIQIKNLKEHYHF